MVSGSQSLVRNLYSGNGYILKFYFSCLSFQSRPSGVARHASHFSLLVLKKSNQKKAHNLTKIDPDITYSLWGGFIQYTLAAPTKTFFTRLSCSSISELASSQYHSDSADFSKHNEATTNKFSRLLFILEQVKTVPNGRLLLLSSACRSKGKKEKRVELLFRSKEKLDVKLDASAAQKKYPLYRLAIISLELLDRKHCEMHPSWLSFAVKLTAFFGYFLLL